jgi:hypothetical protein
VPERKKGEESLDTVKSREMLGPEVKAEMMCGVEEGGMGQSMEESVGAEGAAGKIVDAAVSPSLQQNKRRKRRLCEDRRFGEPKISINVSCG